LRLQPHDSGIWQLTYYEMVVIAKVKIIFMVQFILRLFYLLDRDVTHHLTLLQTDNTSLTPLPPGALHSLWTAPTIVRCIHTRLFPCPLEYQQLKQSEMLYKYVQCRDVPDSNFDRIPDITG